jgi:hypothetical protein
VNGLEAFAAERDTLLTSQADLLKPIIADTLGDESWPMEVLDAAQDIYTDVFEAEDGPGRRRWTTFVVQLRASLDKATEPHDASQVDRIATWMATAVVNKATLDAGGADAVKTWVTMRDEDVRDIHVPLHGQSLNFRERFTVGAAELAYPGEPRGPVEGWINCRCVLRVRSREATMTAAIDEPIEVDDDDPEAQVNEDQINHDPLACSGVLAPEGIASGDGRKFSEGALSWRELPIPLLWQPANLQGHDGAVVVGNIERIERDGNLLRWGGHFASTDAADEVVGLIAERALRGISVDVDSAEMATDPTEENPEVEFSAGRISAATICAIPAFAEAYIQIGDPNTQADPQDVDDEAQVASGDEFKRGPGWITDPVPTARIHNYWIRGKGAAKIRWGTPGDFTRCTRQLRKYIGPQFLNRTCAQWHHDALGYWPGELGKPGNPPDTPENRRRAARHAASADTDCVECEDTALVASVTLTPAPQREAFDAAWFRDPQFTGPQPVTISDDGYIRGHLAVFGTCHIGIQDVCVTPPMSKAAYAYFTTGAVLTTDGEIPVGSITMDTGHASLSANARAAASHYDDTGAVVADVAAGEDQFGIWIAGAIRPGLPADKVERLRASALSGDWRAIRGNLELVAALAVNVPGFPIPRTGLAASAGVQTSLVAAGVVPPADTARAQQVLDEWTRLRAESLIREGV